MRKNKLKCVVFMFFSIMLLFLCTVKVEALEYNVNVESVANLIYGNKYSEGDIKGSSDIDGEFSLYGQDNIVEIVGDSTVEVIFTPKDDTYPVTRINVPTVIEKRRISIVFESPIYKQYDGTNTISLPEYKYEGILDSEVVVNGALMAQLSASYVGEDIPLVLSGVSLIGEKQDYYYIDLANHSARVYPSQLENFGSIETVIKLDQDVYVDIGYSLKVEKQDVNTKVEKLYTSFAQYSYVVYNHTGVELDVKGNYKIMMEIPSEYMEKERLALFELTKDGYYKDLKYTYKDGTIIFSISSGSKLVLSTRDIEYRFIILFSSILLFSVVFVVVYGIRNSKIKGEKEY